MGHNGWPGPTERTVRWGLNPGINPDHLSILPGRLTVEATPHHLLLNTEYAGGLLGKVNPPLRDRKTQVGLLRALVDGKIDVVASDHAPHPLSAKEGSDGGTPSGLPGVQTMLPLLLAQSAEKRVPLPTVIRTVCENPAILMGISKGFIAEGFRADLVVVDMDAPVKLTDDIIASACNWTPYRGHMGVIPQTVFMGGEVIAADGQYTGSPGKGRFLGSSEGRGGS
jgi:dihydroorotase